MVEPERTCERERARAAAKEMHLVAVRSSEHSREQTDRACAQDQDSFAPDEAGVVVDVALPVEDLVDTVLAALAAADPVPRTGDQKS